MKGKDLPRPNNGEILGLHIFGMRAADLIHEASNAIALGTRSQDIRFAVHAHPTLSEVLDELFKSAKLNPQVSSTVIKPVRVNLSKTPGCKLGRLLLYYMENQGKT